MNLKRSVSTQHYIPLKNEKKTDSYLTTTLIPDTVNVIDKNLYLLLLQTINVRLILFPSYYRSMTDSMTTCAELPRPAVASTLASLLPPFSIKVATSTAGCCTAAPQPSTENEFLQNVSEILHHSRCLVCYQSQFLVIKL